MATADTEIDTYKVGGRFHQDGVTNITMDGVEARWVNVKLLGKGGFGSVYLQKKNDSAELRAVKEIGVDRTDTTTVTKLKGELLHLVALRSHGHLFVRLFSWYESKSAIYIAMEYFERGDLASYMRENAAQVQQDARLITTQLLQGLTILHSRHICHRDLKPQNILIVSVMPTRVKLADFGISKSTAETQHMNTFVGTVDYLAPELRMLLFSGKTSGLVYTNAVDIWALGCIVHKILTSELPFAGKPLGDSSVEESGIYPISPSQTAPAYLALGRYLDFCRGGIDLPTEILKESHVGENAIRFLKSLLVFDPKLRISAEDALNNSRWLLELPDPLCIAECSSIVRRQFKFLGIALSQHDTNQLVAEAKVSRDVDIGQFLDIYHHGALISQAASQNFPLGLEMLLRVWPKYLQLTSLEGLVGEAIDRGRCDVLRVLLASKSRSTLGKEKCILPPLLIQAVSAGYPAIVKVLLEDGVDLEAKNKALLRGVVKGHAEVVDILLKAGAHIEALDGNRDTSLLIAIRAEAVGVVWVLLDAGPDVAAKGRDGDTALHLAVAHGLTGVVERLLSAGAYLEAKDSKQRTALHLVALPWRSDKITRMLLAAGADYEARDMDGWTPLHHAAMYEQRECARILIEAGAQINAVDFNHEAVIHKALYEDRGRGGVLEDLIAAGADLEARDRYGRTPLLWAIRTQDEAIVQMLLRAGANRHVTYKDNWTALHHAIKYWLDCDTDVIGVLLEAGLDVDITADENRTPLHLAVICGHKKLIARLLEGGANINAADSSRKTALHLAASKGSAAIVMELLEAGADPMTTDITGRIPLELVALEKCVEIVPLLLVAWGGSVKSNMPAQ